MQLTSGTPGNCGSSLQNLIKPLNQHINELTQHFIIRTF